jgi:hypothetical protein
MHVQYLVCMSFLNGDEQAVKKSFTVVQFVFLRRMMCAIAVCCSSCKAVSFTWFARCCTPCSSTTPRFLKIALAFKIHRGFLEFVVAAKTHRSFGERKRAFDSA